MRISRELEGKVALVTGASRGLGAEIARCLGKRAAKVAVNTFGSPEKAHAVAEAIRQDGSEAEVFRADVRDEAEVRAMVDAVAARFGPVDILVLNATGPQPFVTLEDLTWQDCLDQLEFFVKSPILLTQAVLPSMKARRSGRIIQIGSEVFEKGIPQFSNYVQAKGAQLGLTRSWANELAGWQITVNLIAPGWIPTERHAGDPQAMKEAYAAGVPMKHMGEAEDIGEAVAFLASDSAGSSPASGSRSTAATRSAELEQDQTAMDDLRKEILLGLIDEAYEPQGLARPEPPGLDPRPRRRPGDASAPARPQEHRRAGAPRRLLEIRRPPPAPGRQAEFIPDRGEQLVPVEETLDPAGWKAHVELLDDTHQALRLAIVELPGDRWPEAAPGSKYTYLETVRGIAAHDLYHAGQIQLLKRLGAS